MIYLASPYSHSEAEVRDERFRDACRAAARLIAAGHVVFSPIVHGHPLVRHGLPTDWPFWERFDRNHLARCDEVVVLMLDGWRESVGVAAEIRIAAELGKPVRYLAPDGPVVPPTLAHVAKELGR
jgi:nucleoside 2-deoxyribosyltransferase